MIFLKCKYDSLKIWLKMKYIIKFRVFKVLKMEIKYDDYGC